MKKIGPIKSEVVSWKIKWKKYTEAQRKIGTFGNLEIWKEKTKYLEDRSRRKMSKHQEFQEGKKQLTEERK